MARVLTILSICVVLTWATPVLAAYYNPITDGQGVQYTSIEVLNGLFAQPTARSTGFSMLLTDFRAESSGGTGVIADDRLLMVITAPANQALKEIRLTELGKYNFSDSGTAGTNVSIGANLLLIDHDTGLPVDFIDPQREMQFSPKQSFNRANDGVSGNFTGTLVWDLSGLNIRSVEFDFSNELHANSETGTTSSIEKRYLNESIKIDVYVPEPCTIGLVLLGVMGWTFRRR